MELIVSISLTCLWTGFCVDDVMFLSTVFTCYTLFYDIMYVSAFNYLFCVFTKIIHCLGFKTSRATSISIFAFNSPCLISVLPPTCI